MQKRVSKFRYNMHKAGLRSVLSVIGFSSLAGLTIAEVCALGLLVICYLFNAPVPNISIYAERIGIIVFFVSTAFIAFWIGSSEVIEEKCVET